MEQVDVAWDRGAASMVSTAAMLTRASFLIGSRRIAPFARAPWKPDDDDLRTQPGHVRVLGGDFVALPFGSAPVPLKAPCAWRGSRDRGAAGADAPSPPHGEPADRDWRLRSLGPASLEAELELAAGGVKRLRRRVTGVPGRARIEFELDIEPRSTHRTSIGLHPILALPRRGMARIEVGFSWGRVWPVRLHPDARPLPDAVFTALDSVPAPRGRVDLSLLPPAHPTEEVVQLVDARSPALIRHADGTVVAIEWDDDVLSSLLLWISDRGIPNPPWNHRYRGLGVEPVASAFDFPLATSLADNPLSDAGARTWITLEAGRTLRVRHAVEVMRKDRRAHR